MIKTIAKKGPAHSNQSTEKLLLLIEAMSTLNEPIRLQDLAKLVSMNASTVLRFLAPLQQHGYVMQDPDTSRYHLTFKLCGLANNITARTDIRNIAFPFLRNIAHIFQESANLTIDRDMAVLYVEVVNFPGKALTMMQRIGHVAPLHCTGVGKLFLSEYPAQKLEEYIKVKGLPSFTKNTIIDPEELECALQKVKEKGYSFDEEECEEGARCVAAPIRDYSGDIVAGISVSGPASRMTDECIFRNLTHLLDSARQISFCLGYKQD